MSFFLILMIAGLFGMVLMALPGFSHHAHGIGHVSHGIHAPTAHGHGLQPGGKADGGNTLRFLPSPRSILSVMALYGAFGYAITEMHWLPSSLAAFAALIPALLLERFALTPFWNALLRFQGEPCSDMEALVTTEARAVTPFRNGKGIVEVIRDGRAVQLSAHLPAAQAMMPVRVGDTLRIEDVDAARERVTVSLH